MLLFHAIKIVKKHMHFLYNLLIALYGFFIRVAAVCNTKVKKREIGSKHWEIQLKGVGNIQQSVVWIHCASAGEFEQAIPIIQELKQKYPSYFIAVSFSPLIIV